MKGWEWGIGELEYEEEGIKRRRYIHILRGMGCLVRIEGEDRDGDGKIGKTGGIFGELLRRKQYIYIYI